MPIPSDYQDIVDMLLTATNEGRVKWAPARFGYEVTVGENRFIVWNGTDEETNRGFISFALTDRGGKALDTWYVDESESAYDSMGNLFAGAKRQALGIPKILAGLKEAIEKGGTIGDKGAGERESKRGDIPF